MILDLEAISPNQTYFHMTQTLVPRPIAWVLSANATGTFNLAPFSFFNAVCSDPPLVMISVGKKPDGSEKDTRCNIKQRKHFTVHIASSPQLEALNDSSATLNANESELDELGLSTVNFADAPAPRLADCKIAYACELYDIHEIGPTPQAVIYGKVNSIYIDDDIMSQNEKGRIKIHTDRLQPIARLGASEYMMMGKTVSLKRPY